MEGTFTLNENAINMGKISIDPKNLNPFEKNIYNSLSELTSILGIGNVFGTSTGAPLSRTDTMYYNNRWNLITINRTLVTEMYIEHGIVQTLVDQPVDDAFRAGFEVISDQISPDQIEDLKIYIEQERVIESIMQGIKWTRLFGGGGLIIVTDQDPAKPFNINSVNANTPLFFRPVDSWELIFLVEDVPQNLMPVMSDSFYQFYGVPIHATRVMPMRGKIPPSLRRPQFRGWGMSELERLVRSINQYLKNNDVIFELLDEAKIDVYKINQFTSSLLTANGTQGVAKRIQHANYIKNYNNALVMDVEDEYEQKQIAFTGLSEMLQQIRIGIAADLKMPVTKLFGMSAAGFNSGEDDIENYNSMIEGEVRSKCKYMVVNALKICCQKLFGFVPDDLHINWNPLRILSAEEEEKVKDSKFKRILDAYQAGLMQDFEAKSSINKANLMPIKIDENVEAQLPFGKGEDDDDFELKDKGKL